MGRRQRHRARAQPSDHLFHIRAIWAAAGVTPGEADDSVRALDAPGVDYTRASASLLVRTLYEQTEPARAASSATPTWTPWPRLSARRT